MTNYSFTWKSSTRYPASLARELGVNDFILVASQGVVCLTQTFKKLINLVFRRGKAGDQSEHGLVGANEMGRGARRGPLIKQRAFCHQLPGKGF